MKRASPLELRLAPVALLAMALSGCFLLSEPPITYNVHVAWLPPDSTISFFCYGLYVTAEFGASTLLDVSVDQTNPDGFITGKETKASRQQNYVAGMPLEIEVVCRNEQGEEIGRSLFVGELITPYESGHFTIWNFAHPDLDQSECVAPVESSGIQICGDATGFRFG